ncbi:MAG: hypothetical protein JNL30_07615 [Rubrivivax sp.]|nr:hypothetical protein [Rubrivivax sp.]
MGRQYRTLSSALGLALFALQGVTSANDTDAVKPRAGEATRFEHAQARYEAGHYAEAYARFAQLADCGHREAARIAWQMRQFGPQLYGTQFTAGPQQLWRWRALIAAEARPAVDAACAAAEPPGAVRGKPSASAPGAPAAPSGAHGEHPRQQGTG